MRRVLFVGWLPVFSLLTVMFLAGPARAADAEHDEAKGHGDAKAHADGKAHGVTRFKVTFHGAEGEEEKVLDVSNPAHAQQLHELIQEGKLEEMAADKPPDPLAIRWDLGLWTLVVFLLLVFILSKVAWKPMLEGLQGREARIRGALDEAHSARDEAHKLRDQFQAEMNKVQDKMREMVEEARRDGQALKDRLVAEGKTEIQTERDRAQREIQSESARVKQELWSQAARLATLVSGKVISRSLTVEDHRGLVDEAVAELRGAADQKTTA
jgi:F-type H+-transporting ATPase subunit b